MYRIYPVGGVRSAEDERYFSQALDAARASLARADHVVLDQVAQWLGSKLPDDAQNAAERNRDRGHTQAQAGQNSPSSTGSQRRAEQTLFSQLTSPGAAKAVEDTACYRYGRLISRNEVGADPGEFSLSVEQFHEGNAKRFATFPHAMLYTATHDHKRGEDVRARIATLSQIPDEWAATLRQWSTLNTPLRRGPDGGHGETSGNGN